MINKAVFVGCVLFMSIGFLATSAIANVGCVIVHPDNTISVDCKDVDISEIVKQISREAGLNIFLETAIRIAITSQMDHIPLELGIKRMLGKEVSSAFIFVKEKNASGKDMFRLDTVKIFSQGHLLSADYTQFERGIPKESTQSLSAKGQATRTGSNSTPAAIERNLQNSRRNIEIIRQKKQAETDALQRNLVDLKMQLSQNPSPDERIVLLERLSSAENQIEMIEDGYSRLLSDEEGYITSLIEEKANMESRIKYAERHREIESQQGLEQSE